MARNRKTIDHFMRKKEMEGGFQSFLLRDGDVPLLKRGDKGRREVERDMGKQGHRQGLVFRALKEHTVASGALAARML